LDDAALVLHYKQSRQSIYYEELFKRHVRFVIAVCMKYMNSIDQAEDISMEVMEKAITDLERFDILNFKSWIYTAARNACLMKLRSDKKMKEYSIDTGKNLLQIVEKQNFMHPDNSNSIEQETGYLSQAIEQLDEGQKKCIELFYLQEKSYKEIADETGLTMNEVKSFIQNGKRNLKNLLIKTGQFGILMLFITSY